MLLALAQLRECDGSRGAKLQVEPGDLLEIQLTSRRQRSIPLEKRLLWRMESMVLYCTEIPLQPPLPNL